ncbi:RRP7A protein, partial [Atractosteus spatula]|nr:RRP7A protein [Atractosteus spatula]
MSLCVDLCVSTPPLPLSPALPVQFSQSSQAHHWLYLKEHRVRAESSVTRPLDQTLFVLNVPPYCSEECLLRLFSPCGPVQSVELRERPGPKEQTEPELSKYFRKPRNKGFSVAYVVFKKASGVAAAKKLRPETPLVLSTTEHPLRTGLQKWIEEYSASIVQADELQAAVDQYMQEYDRRVEEEAKREAEEEGKPDEEGWVKVSRRGRRPARPHTEAANQRALERERRKRARKELLNFYSWQHRETQREHIAELRRKFEEDKQRIAVLRAQRKFRPY